jgi:predicted nucleotide-binding protein (sugar kinase/HSP70/actin superfamily)
MADQFGLPVTEYAETAFSAELAPRFSYGCAVFLDTDRVNFQKEGFSKEELLAGLAQVLPKNVWQYVVGVPRLASLGRRFVLQGGTQYNLAAVKAQVDYIKERVPDAEIFVHPHTGEAGALGAAIETLRVVTRRGQSRFIGLDAAIELQYSTKNDETTTCHFCENECSRTFVDALRPDGSTARYISGFSCEKGTVESEAEMIALTRERQRQAKKYPNLVDYEAKAAFMTNVEVRPLPEAGAPMSDVKVERSFLGRMLRSAFTRAFQRSGQDAVEKRKRWRVGLPRVLNMYSTGPFWTAYFRALGVDRRNIVWSDETSEERWVAGGKYGSVDPCFPSKVVQAHVHQLLFDKHVEKPLNAIFFPILTHVPSFAWEAMDTASCPIVAGTPEVIKAAFTKEQDFFAARGIRYMSPAFSFAEPVLLKRRMFDAFEGELGITEDESSFAVDEGLRVLRAFEEDLMRRGRAILEAVEKDDAVAILVLGRPYHSDPGLHHGIPDEFQVLGYPILSIRSLPRDRAFLDRFFEEDLKAGLVDHPLRIDDVWPENYSANSAQRVWAAKFAARHPNVVLLDLSSFKCGHDAPTYGIIDGIVQKSAVPHAALHDIDANKPGGSIAIRVKTYAHSLSLHEERLKDLRAKKNELEHKLTERRLFLLEEKQRRLGEKDARDAALAAEIASLGEKLRAFVPAPKPVSHPVPKGLVRLGKKTESGEVVRI